MESAVGQVVFQEQHTAHLAVRDDWLTQNRFCLVALEVRLVLPT